MNDAYLTYAKRRPYAMPVSRAVEIAHHWTKSCDLVPWLQQHDTPTPNRQPLLSVEAACTLAMAYCLTYGTTFNLLDLCRFIDDILTSTDRDRLDLPPRFSYSSVRRTFARITAAMARGSVETADETASTAVAGLVLSMCTSFLQRPVAVPVGRSRPFDDTADPSTAGEHVRRKPRPQLPDTHTATEAGGRS